MNFTQAFKLNRAVSQLRALLEASPPYPKSFSTAVQANINETIRKRNFLFSEEKKRQYESVGRIEKIKIAVTDPPENVNLVMNKDISTPHDCAMHISEAVVKRSALALVNSSIQWDMHCPLPTDCTLNFLHFKSSDPHFVNKAFWRTCSIVLGAVISNSFKENIKIVPHSFPSPNVRSGSFVYDVFLGLDNWTCTSDELRILSSEMVKMAARELPIERLAVTKELALEIFEGNLFKQQQIPNIAAKNEGNEVVLYRVGNYIDISRGPMVGNTSFVGRCTITAVHKINTEIGDLYRFQGVALPKGIMLNHFAYGLLENRARRLNQGRFPGSTPIFTVDSEIGSSKSQAISN